MALPVIPTATPPITVTKSDGSTISVPSPVVTALTNGVKMVGAREVIEALTLDTNFVQMIEHFASATQPTTPLVGQMWYDTSETVQQSRLKVWTGVSWEYVSVAGGELALPGNTTITPAPSSGAGTSASPYVVNLTTLNAGETGTIVATVSITGLRPLQFVPIIDLNSSANGGRFITSGYLADNAGTLSISVVFNDSPASPVGTVYTAQFQIGLASVYINFTGTTVATEFPVTPINYPNPTTPTTPATTTWTGANDTLTPSGCLQISTDGVTWTSSPTGMAITTGQTLYTRWTLPAPLAGTCLDSADGTTLNATITSAVTTLSDTATPVTVDKLPSAVTFTADTAAINTVKSSNIVTISGINSYGYITGSTTGTVLEFSKDNGVTWTAVPAVPSATAYVLNGDTLQLRHTTGGTIGTGYTSTIAIGSLTGVTYTTTTAASAFPQAVNYPTVAAPTTPAATTWTSPNDTLTASGCVSISTAPGGPFVKGPMAITTGQTLYTIWDLPAPTVGTCLDLPDGTTLNGTLTASGGGVDNAPSINVDKTPSGITFTADTASINTVKQSNSVAISGINSYAYITGSTTGTVLEFSKDAGVTWTAVPAAVSAAAYVMNGDNLLLRHTTGGTVGTAYTATVSVGGLTGVTYTTTTSASAFPQSVNYPSGLGQVGTTWTSANDTLTAGGCISISTTSGGPYVKGPLAITTGQTLYTSWDGAAGSGTCIDSAHGTNITGTLTASGGGVDNSSLTVDKEPTPALVDETVTGAALSSTQTFTAQTVNGVNSYVYITAGAAGSSISINGGAFAAIPTAGTGTYVTQGQTIQVQHTNSALNSTATTTTLTVGTQTGVDFASTTVSAVPAVATPVIDTPVNLATGLALTPFINSSAYSASGGAGTHLSSDWEIATDAAFTTIVVNNAGDTTNKENWTVPAAAGLLSSTTYYVRVRYNSNPTAVTSSWSNVVQFTTGAAPLVPAWAAGALRGYVALSGDGNVCVTGAQVEFGPRIFTRSGGVWSLAQTLATSTYMVQISDDGDTIASSNSNASQVYIHKRSAGVWALAATINSPNGAGSQDMFGVPLCLSSDGTKLVVGCGDLTRFFGSNGKLYSYTNTSGNVWTLTGVLADPWGLANDIFPDGLALSGDGSTVAVSSRNGTGVRIYNFSLTVGTLISPSMVNPIGGSGKRYDMSLNSDGTTLAIGQGAREIAGTSFGGVEIWTGPAWAQQGGILTPSDPTLFQAGAIFGSAVSISGDGNTLLISQPFSGITPSPAYSIIPTSGCVYVFGRSAGVWSQSSVLSSVTRTVGDNAGAGGSWALDISADKSTYAVGSILADGNAGRVWIWDGTTQQARFSYSDGAATGGYILTP